MFAEEKKLKEEEAKDKWFKVLNGFEEFDKHMVVRAQDSISSLLTFVSRFTDVVTILPQVF